MININVRTFIIIIILLFTNYVFSSSNTNYLIYETIPPETEFKPSESFSTWTIEDKYFELVCYDPPFYITIDSATYHLPGSGCNAAYYSLTSYNSPCPSSGYTQASLVRVENENTLDEKKIFQGVITPPNNYNFLIGKVCYYSVDIADNVESVKESSSQNYYYCFDGVAPKFVSISHSPEFIASKDNTFDPYPNTYIDFNGNSKQLTPDKIVIDKERVTIEVAAEDKDPYGYERSGIKSISINFLGTNSIKSDFQSSCPNGATYTTPASHSHNFSNPTIGWNNVSSSITDFAGNSASNSNYKFYVFLGALGTQNNQRSNDKLVFLKTYWDSSSEVKQITNNLGGSSSSKINCYGYNSKCTLIRDIIGKTDEFTDCLWVGPSNNPRNVKIYNFKEIVDLEKNEIATASYSKYEENNNKIIYAWVNPKAEDLKKIAICSKNDTGILVDLPFLVSKNVPDGFRMLLTERNVFSVQWEVEYAREQREVSVECYL
ncbi:MAG: hypothetical protein QXL14_04010, partial [Candidatus Aenigmatarchaeota archaeon]